MIKQDDTLNTIVINIHAAEQASCTCEFLNKKYKSSLQVPVTFSD